MISCSKGWNENGISGPSFEVDRIATLIKHRILNSHQRSLPPAARVILPCKHIADLFEPQRQVAGAHPKFACILFCQQLYWQNMLFAPPGRFASLSVIHGVAVVKMSDCIPVCSGSNPRELPVPTTTITSQELAAFHYCSLHTTPVV